jgi:hypothetical protein
LARRARRTVLLLCPAMTCPYPLAAQVRPLTVRDLMSR